MRHAQRGFTLLEMVIVVIVLGIVMIALAPLARLLLTSQEQVAARQAELNNRLIGAALVDYAANSTALGSLPAPYSGGGYIGTVYNPADGSAAGIALGQQLMQAGVSPVQINDDGTAAHNVRVYQRVTGLTMAMPLYTQSGPLVRLTYQLGAVYQTACGRNAGTCASAPGVSAALTAANVSTWTTTPPDGAPTLISSLPLQKAMLTTSVSRVDRLRDQILGYFRAAQIAGAAGDATNYYPPTVSTLGGANPASNQGCRDGWYDLAGTPVLATVGLSPAEYGATAWGGHVEYCRDYDPTGTKVANATPHYAAIRFNADVSLGANPDTAVPGNNVVLSF